MSSHSAIPDAPASRRSLGLAAWMHLGLFIVVFTGFLPWSYAHGLFPLRPALFIGVMVLLCSATTFFKGPVFARSTLVILGLLMVRAADAGLQRWPNPEGWQDHTFSLGSAFLLSFTTACAAGYYITRDRRPLLITSALTILVCAGANIAEFLGVFSYSTSEGRAAGFIGDANDSGIAIVCMMAVYLSLSRRFSHSAIILVLAAAGVFPTLSRSGLLMFSLTAIAWAGLNFREHFTKILLGIAAFITLAGAGVGWMAANASGGNANVQNRMNAIFGGDVDKMESTERMKDLMDGVEAAAQNSVTGVGTGAGTNLWRPHNMFVSLWIDLGLLAAAAYAGALLSVLIASFLNGGQGLLCAIPAIGFVPFSQMLMETSAYMLCVFTGAALASRHPLRFSLRRDSTSTSSAHGLPA